MVGAAAWPLTANFAQDGGQCTGLPGQNSIHTISSRRVEHTRTYALAWKTQECSARRITDYDTLRICSSHMLWHGDPLGFEILQRLRLDLPELKKAAAGAPFTMGTIANDESLPIGAGELL